jgi:shikimate dehydrogenase
MQEAAFRAVGLDWSYQLLDIPSSELPHAVERLRAPEVAGANVTIPHKMAVIDLLDELADSASEAGAVNTIYNLDGRLRGSNTDVAGIRAALAETGVDPAGAETVVLGVGGSAHAAAVALNGARLTFVALRPERGIGLPGRVVAWTDPAWPDMVRGADLLVNCTPLGGRGEMPVDIQGLPRAGAVLDLVYVLGGTPLVRAAAEQGLPCADGWVVLLAQGAVSFKTWTGLAAPVDAMRKALAG